MDILALFCDIDDFCQLFEPMWRKRLLETRQRHLPGRGGVGRRQEASCLGAHLRQRQPDGLPLDFEHGEAFHLAGLLDPTEYEREGTLESA